MSVGGMANLCHPLMTVVPSSARYGTRSSDLGAGVATQLALTHTDAMLGVHPSRTTPYAPEFPADRSLAEQELVENART